MEEKKFPRVGVGVLVMREGKVLMGKRIGSHGAGTWCFPGGHLEYGEGFEECARREVLEETGLEVDSLQRVGFTNDVFEKEGKHYVTVFFRCEKPVGEVELREPQKCEKWAWFSWNGLPQPLFAPSGQLIAQLKEKGLL